MVEKEKKDCDRERELQCDRMRGLRVGARIDEEYCDEEEKYQLISKDEEEVSNPDYDMPTTPRTYPATMARPKSASKSVLSNHSNSDN